MSTAINRADESVTRKYLNDLIKTAAQLREVGPSIWNAAQDLLTALEYDDDVLTNSATSALNSALRELLQNFINSQIGTAERVKSALNEIRAGMRGKCFEDDIDEFAKDVIKLIDHVLRRWTDAQRSALKLRNLSCEVLRLTELQFEIDALREIREKFSNDWPWSSSWNPPLDKEQAARSRAAFERGECKTVGELLDSLQ